MNWGAILLLFPLPNEAHWDFNTEPPESGRPEARGSPGCEGQGGGWKLTQRQRWIRGREL